MFGSSTLDVALGLVFLYLLLSLLCTALNELLEAAVQKRGEYLRAGIAELLAVAPDVNAGTWVYQFLCWVLNWFPWLLSWLPSVVNSPVVLLNGFVRFVSRRRGFANRVVRLKGLLRLPLRLSRWTESSLGRAARWLRSVGADAPAQGGLLERVYRHPFIASLYSGRYGSPNARLPAYIPSRQFALAMLDLVMPARAGNKSGAAFATGGPEQDADQVATHIANLRAAVGANNELTAEVRTALLALIDAAGNDLERIRDGIEKWYDGTMDRVAGWYRRRVQYVSVAVGVLMTVVLNADTFAIANALARDQTLRATVATAAENYAKAHAPPAPKAPADDKTKADDVKAALTRVSDGVNQVRGFGWPLGWDFADDRTIPENPLRQKPAAGGAEQEPPAEVWVWDWRATGAWFLKAIGWVLTAAAVSLGAPFWFDILNRLIVIRSTVKPTEKSPNEPPVDR